MTMKNLGEVINTLFAHAAKISDLHVWDNDIERLVSFRFGKNGSRQAIMHFKDCGGTGNFESRLTNVTTRSVCDGLIKVTEYIRDKGVTAIRAIKPNNDVPVANGRYIGTYSVRHTECSNAVGAKITTVAQHNSADYSAPFKPTGAISKEVKINGKPAPHLEPKFQVFNI